MAKAKKEQVFPSIKTKAMIGQITVKKGCCDIKLADVELTGGQYETIKDMLDEGDSIFVTFARAQGKLFSEPDKPGKKSMAETVAETE